MTPATIVQIVGWAATAIKTIADVVDAALKANGGKTLDQLDEELATWIAGRRAERARAAAEALAAANQALTDAAASEFDEALAADLAEKPKP